ncbi:MAG: hypothetical protein WCO00_14540 [Rhodospirillaceae bacterium]
MALTETEKKSKEAQLVRQMAGKLRHDIGVLEKYRATTPPGTFLEFCAIRRHHNDIQGLIYVIQERMPWVAELLPANIGDWIIQAKMKALASFIEISRKFVGNPPLTLTGSLTARDVLTNECKNFSDARDFFNKILMEQALDDKTADALDRTLVMIDETIEIIERLLSRSVNYLDEF